MAVSPDASEEANALSFEITDQNEPTPGGARLGRLAVKSRKDLSTPNFFAISSRGAVPHLTPDMIIEHAKFGGVHMALEDCKF